MNYPIRQFWNLNNYGDELGPYITWKLTNQFPKHTFPIKYFFKHLFKSIYNFIVNKDIKTADYLFSFSARNVLITVGSILEFASKNDIIWGSGMGTIQPPNISNAKFYSVRGPISKKYIKSLGYEVGENMGDPALLMPILLNNQWDKKKHKLTLIPHKNDYMEICNLIDESSTNFDVIDLSSTDIERVTELIASSNYILSSSLHGLIVGHAYGVPSLWFKNKEIGGDDTKFFDYFGSVGITDYLPFDISILNKSIKEISEIFNSNKNIFLIQKDLKKIQVDLLNNSPFNNISIDDFF